MITILFQDAIHRFRYRIDYVLDFIEKHSLVDGKLQFTRQVSEAVTIKIAYGMEQPGGFFIPANEQFFSAKVPPFESLVANTYFLDNNFVYSVENQPREKKEFIRKGRFQFDLIETIFFHISRFEEWHYLNGREDNHGRMDARQQFLVKNGMHRIPVVDHLVLNFVKALGIELKDQKTRIRITHDIDFIEKKNDLFHTLRSMGGAVLKRGSVTSALKIWQSRHEKNPYDTFEWMLRTEMEPEKAIYFLMSGKSPFDNFNDPQLPVFKKVISISKARGYTIGIHPSYESWKDAELFADELQQLQNITGGAVRITRQHFLRFSFPHTPRIIEKLGLKEDSSLGYADRLGFRCGTGFGFRLYDFEHEKAFDFLETPLVFMDSALFSEAGFDPEKVQKIMDEFLAANRFNTKITFNFHNSRFYDAQIRGIPLRSLYEGLF